MHQPTRLSGARYKEDFAQQYDKCGARSGSPQLFEALKLIRIIYTVLMQNRSCFTRKQTCDGEYMWERNFVGPSDSLARSII